MKLENFLIALGSKKGAPGGGAAAALTGATGAALAEMIARLNDARSGRSSGAAGRAAQLRHKLQGLILEDAKAFKRIQRAYKVRRKDPGAWQRALKAGAAVPMRICEVCAAAVQPARAEKKRTSRWLESDRREALLLLRAAFDAGVLNVEVNLREMTDRAFCERATRKMNQWRHKFPKS